LHIYLSDAASASAATSRLPGLKPSSIGPWVSTSTSTRRTLGFYSCTISLSIQLKTCNSAALIVTRPALTSPRSNGGPPLMRLEPERTRTKWKSSRSRRSSPRPWFSNWALAVENECLDINCESLDGSRLHLDLDLRRSRSSTGLDVHNASEGLQGHRAKRPIGRHR